MLTWQLDDPTDIASANKYTFYKPSPEVLAKVAVGEVVKLIFRGEGDGADNVHVERMWVIVDVVHPGGRFEGRLDNDPYNIRGLQADDPVSFEARHIIDTAHQDPHDFTAKYVKRAFITHRILRDGQPICFLYREAPDDEQDSGWRFTAAEQSFVVRRPAVSLSARHPPEQGGAYSRVSVRLAPSRLCQRADLQQTLWLGSSIRQHLDNAEGGRSEGLFRIPQ